MTLFCVGNGGGGGGGGGGNISIGVSEGYSGVQEGHRRGTVRVQ